MSDTGCEWNEPSSGRAARPVMIDSQYVAKSVMEFCAYNEWISASGCTVFTRYKFLYPKERKRGPEVTGDVQAYDVSRAFSSLPAHPRVMSYYLHRYILGEQDQNVSNIYSYS